MTRTPHRPIRKFSPGTHQSDEEVTEQFVVRNHELGVLLDVLRGNIESRSCQHALIVAPRGRGKTMLLARAAAEIRMSRELARHLLPVSFMEESQEIFNLTDFWLETLFHLARECAPHDSQLAGELRDRHAALSERWREPALEDHARAAVLDAADRLDRRLVLMVENLQALCKHVDPDFGWKLRGVLQTEPQIMLLASATSRFAGLDDAEQPFFEMFRIINLKPLTTEQCRSLWKVVSGDTVTGREVRPLEILTGGSPRLLVIVAGFGRHKSLRRLMEELVMLIDEHTEYFRGHLDVLGKTERRVYIAVLDLWRQSSPSEIAARARMDVRTVSTMLGRLLDRGALTLEGSGRKRKYAACEPLYCIYYKLRRGRGEAAVVENLIRFMSVFYSEAERAEIFPAVISEGMESPALRHGLDGAAAALPEFAGLISDMREPGGTGARPAGIGPGSGVPAGLAARSVATAPDCHAIERLLKDISAAADREAFRTVVDIVDRSSIVQSPAPHSVSQMFAAWAVNMKGDALRKIGDLDAALSAHEEVVRRFGTNQDAHVRMTVARALASKGLVREQMGNPRSALPAYKEVVDRFGDSGDPGHREWAARALIRNGHILRQVADPASALSAYEEVVHRFGVGEGSELQECVASALIGKGYVLELMDDPKSALAAYGEVGERFGSSNDVELNRRIAEALYLKSNILRTSGDAGSALSAYDEIAERFDDNPDIELQRWVAEALYSIAGLQTELGNTASAVSAYAGIVRRFGASDSAELAGYAAAALNRKGSALLELGDAESAIATFDDFLDRFGSAGDSRLQEWIAKTLFDMGRALDKLGKPDLAVSACRQAVERFGSSEDADMLWWVSAALAQMTGTLRKSGKLDAALVACDETVKRFGTSEKPRLRWWAVLAAIDKAGMLVEAGRSQDALRTCDEFEARLHNLDDDIERDLSWRARQIRTQALLALRDLPAAVAMFRSLHDAFVPDDEVMMRDILVLTLELIAAGASVHELLDILSSDADKAAALGALAVAVRQHLGEVVREPNEILEVASDIRDRVQETCRRKPESTARAVADA